jgi:hypothetical protein
MEGGGIGFGEVGIEVGGEGKKSGGVDGGIVSANNAEL